MLSKNKVYKMVLSAMFLALAMILPFLTGQIPQIGAALCPMHLPVLLCGFFCGPLYGGVVGLIAPLLRFAIFGMPPIIPSGVGMCFELMAYGVFSGLLYRLLPKKKVYVYASLITSMIIGRIIWGIVRVILYGVGGYEFGWEAFMAGAFINAIPGIIVQIVLVPIMVIVLNKSEEHSSVTEEKPLTL